MKDDLTKLVEGSLSLSLSMYLNYPHSFSYIYSFKTEYSCLVREILPFISTSSALVTRCSEGNQVHTYMRSRIKFHAYSDI
jgi:hypothetical protein